MTWGNASPPALAICPSLRPQVTFIVVPVIPSTYYKGHMNKSKGEGGEGGGKWVHLEWGEGMGEKAYNCN